MKQETSKHRDEWRKKRKLDGWKAFYVYCPEVIYDELMATKRKMKLLHNDLYSRI
jgi:hypothetical protein